MFGLTRAIEDARIALLTRVVEEGHSRGPARVARWLS